MTASSTPTLDMLPTMRAVAEAIAEDARDNLAGVDVINVSPLYAEPVPGGTLSSFPSATAKTFRPTLSCSISRKTHLWPNCRRA